jgi:hypothetical protein
VDNPCVDFAREIAEIGTFLTTEGFPFAVVGGVGSWLDLGADEIEALLPPGLLERRPPTSSRRRPFSLE